MEVTNDKAGKGKTDFLLIFSLPPNPNTKSKHSHGVHYIKLFPIEKQYLDTYIISSGDIYYSKVFNVLNRNERKIITACQDYLQMCEQGNRHFMTPDIDGILNMLDGIHSEKI